jgi:outer membrane receptor protein involved in Fe transport
VLGGALFRLAGGARAERSTISIKARTLQSPDIVESGPEDFEILPSANLTYILNENTNLRLAYSHSVNRPEMRELAGYQYYDFSENELYQGNPDLARSYIRNYDARVEYFPSPGEVVAASYFYKDLRNPIEQKLLLSSNPTRTFTNAEKGLNRGWEIELRKNLGFLGAYFRNVLVGGNYTSVNSDVVVNSSLIRELQGQAPFTYNLFFQFGEPTIRTTVSLWYYRFGRRLDTISDNPEQDVFEDERGTLDFAVNQPLFERIEAKFTIRDLGAKRRNFSTRQGDFYKSVFSGDAYSLSITYRF